MVMRFDPFRELDRLGHDLWNGGKQRPSAMPLDAYRRGDTFFVHFDLPGVDPASVDLTVENNVLTVKAERSWPWGDDVELLVAERPQGSFTRQLFLGETLRSEGIDASYDDGVLTVRIPVAEEAKPRKVQIGVGNKGSTAISANATTADASSSDASPHTAATAGAGTGT